ncbi:MAG: thiamine phosphate synthase [Rivihabitans pingtungensis]
MAWPDALPRRGLYLITPDTTDSLRLFSQCLRVLPARPALLQYRNKSTDPALRLAQAQTLRALTRAAGVGLIINDDVALAAQVGADGVHLGRDDGDIAAARARLGEHAILGAPCKHDQLPLARAAIAAGAPTTWPLAPSARPPPTERRARPAQSVCRQRRTGAARRLAASPATAGEIVAAGADMPAVIGSALMRGRPRWQRRAR